MFMTSAPSRLPASSNDACVRVELSKNRLMSVRPRRTCALLLRLGRRIGVLVGEVEKEFDFGHRQLLRREKVAMREALGLLLCGCGH